MDEMEIFGKEKFSQSIRRVADNVTEPIICELGASCPLYWHERFPELSRSISLPSKHLVLVNLGCTSDYQY